MPFTKIAAAGIGSTGTVTLENLVVTGSLNAASLTGAASTANVRTNTLNVSGVSTLGSTVVGGGTTQLVVNGSARITGILTIGTSSITLDGTNNQVNVGTGVTIHHTNGVQVGGNTVHSTGLTVNQINATGVSTIGNTVVGGATTELVVNGNARITGILTVGTASITFNGNDNSVTIGTGVTVFGNVGIISATEFRGNGANLTGVQPFPSGTLMLFQQTAAPTGWTKQTTHNDKTLRVVSGSASSGGSTAFTSVFTSRTPSGSVSVSGSNSGGSVANTTATGTVGGTTLAISQIPNHDHGFGFRNGAANLGYGYASSGGALGEAAGGGTNLFSNTNTRYSNTAIVDETGGSGSHNHSLTMDAHGHTFTNPTWSGSGSFTGSSMDFAVQYVDLIIASKN